MHWCVCHREKLSHCSLCQLDPNASLITWFTAVIMPSCCCWHKMLLSLNVTGRLLWPGFLFQEVNRNVEIPSYKTPEWKRTGKKTNLLLTLFVVGINWLHDSSSTLGKGKNKNKPVLCGQVVIAEILELFSVQVRSAKGFLGMGQGNIRQGVTSCQTTWRNMSRQVRCNQLTACQESCM